MLQEPYGCSLNYAFYSWIPIPDHSVWFCFNQMHETVGLF
jgi:hypothetical protein